MKRAIFISVTILLQLVYYLALFKVIDTTLFDSFFARFVVTFPVWFAIQMVLSICGKHIHKWFFNTVYVLLLACGLVVPLSFAGFNLGAYTHLIVFVTIFPMSYGAYVYCKQKKEKDSWHFISKIILDNSLIVDKPEGIDEIEAVIGKSDNDVSTLKQKHDIYSYEVLKYAQGELKTLEKYLFSESSSGQIDIIIEQPIEISDKGDELPLEPMNPHIYCDGSEHAILVYNSEKTFGLGYMNENIFQKVNALQSILVIEAKLDYNKSQLGRTFYAPVIRVKALVLAELPKPIESQGELSIPMPDCTRGDMLAELPRSAKLSDEKLLEIKNQLISGLNTLNIEVERVKMEIGEKSVTCQLYYNAALPTLITSGFPGNINIFYRISSIDREEKIMTIDIPYKKQVA